MNALNPNDLITTGELTEAILADLYLRKGYPMQNLRAEVRDSYLARSERMIAIAEAADKIQDRVNQFGMRVWYCWLRSYWNESDYRGHKCSAGYRLQVLMWGSAGRVLITVKRRFKLDRWITMIFADSGSQMGGIQGICATLPEALWMIDEAIARPLRFKHSNTVGIAV